MFRGDSTFKRCDYVVEIAEVPTSVYYIELKGSKIAHGIEQLSATLEHFAGHHDKAATTCVLIASSVPALKAGTQADMDKFYRDHKVKLRIKRSEYTVVV